MKKILFILAFVLVLLTVSAFADEINVKNFVGKMGLWDHSFVVVDQSDNVVEVPVRVTIETTSPINIESLPVADELADSLCIVQIDREGVGTVLVALSPADLGLHYNLNDYTDEMLDVYIAAAAAGSFEEGKYTAEKKVSEGGNKYVCITDATSQLLSTIYDDFTMEFYLVHYDKDAEGNTIMAELTDEDKAFATEIFQSVWTEKIEYPDYDTLLTANVNKQWLSDIGLDSLNNFADILNDYSLKIHTEETLGKISLLFKENELANIVYAAKEDGIYIMSNLLGNKALLISYETLLEQVATIADEPSESSEEASLFKFGYVYNTISALEEISPELISISQEGVFSFTLSAENTAKIIKAFVEDMMTTNSFEYIMMAKMIESVAPSVLPKGNVLSVTATPNADGNGLTMNTVVNWVDPLKDEAKTVTSVEVLTISEDSLAVNGTVELPDSSVITTTFNASSEKVSLEILYEAMADGKKVPGYSLTYNSDKSADNASNVFVDELAFNVPDEKGNLTPLWTVTGMYNNTDVSTVTGLLLSWSGYDEPVVKLASNTSFCEEVVVAEPTEVIDVLTLDDNKISELVNDISANFEKVTGSPEAAK